MHKCVVSNDSLRGWNSDRTREVTSTVDPPFQVTLDLLQPQSFWRQPHIFGYFVPASLATRRSRGIHNQSAMDFPTGSPSSCSRLERTQGRLDLQNLPPWLERKHPSPAQESSLIVKSLSSHNSALTKIQPSKVENLFT